MVHRVAFPVGEGVQREPPAELFPETVAYDGCEGIELYFNTDDKDKMVMVEHWASRSHQEKYVAWRTETGVMDKIGSMLAGPPSLRYFEKAGA